MKKICIVSMIAILLLSAMISPVSANSNEISVYLDAVKIEFDVKPQIIDGRTMVPIRAIFEKMGAHVEWDGNTSTAICTKGNTIVKMTVNSTDMYVNQHLTKMDISPVVIDGRTLAPARYVAEAFGADVQWDPNTNSVLISSKKVTLYALDGRTIAVLESEMHAYLQVGWYRTLAETQQTMYAPDGRTITVYKAEVPTYQNVGWYTSAAETRQTMYAPDGRTITVYKAEVPAYQNAGWYTTLSAAQAANRTTAQSAPQSTNNTTQSAPQSTNKNTTASTYNPEPDGNYYRTPTGKRYHLDPNCGGKNSYKTTDISGLTPCAKCAK